MSLLQRVSRICNSGRVVQHSDGSVNVLNCPYWSPRDSTMLQYDCPGAVISVQSSVSSLSGFVVVIRQPITASGGEYVIHVVYASMSYMLFMHLMHLSFHRRVAPVVGVCGRCNCFFWVVG